MAEKPTRVIELPETGTNPALEYFWTANCDRYLFSFLISTVTRADYVQYITNKALEGGTADEMLSHEEHLKTIPGHGTKLLRNFRQELLEMFICRSVDNFNIYLVDIVRSVLHKQPRILSDRKQELTIKHILQFDSIEALTRDIVESKVTALSYDGFGDLEDWCKTKGIPLLVPDAERDKIVNLLSMRNLIVHNRCIIDERYRNAVNSGGIVGDKLAVSVDDLTEGWGILDKVVQLTDSAISGKFSLETTIIRSEVETRHNQRLPKEDDVSDVNKKLDHVDCNLNNHNSD